MIKILLISIGLAMDAFAISISSGLTIKKLKVQNAFKIALFFGGFQAIMPVLGWISGISIKNYIAGIDHWIAFGILSVIGIKMIYESVKIEKEKNKMNILNTKVLFILAVATSIDAFAVGVSFVFLSVAIIKPAVIIGIITFIMSFTGVFIGERIGHLFEDKIEIVGGLILIGIGIKILLTL